jgi:hypothetical protein
MDNITRYNLTAYNRSGKRIQRVESEMRGSSTFGGIFGSAKRMRGTLNGSSRVLHEARLRILAVSRMIGLSALEQLSRLSMRVRSQMESNSRILSDSHIGKLMFVSFSGHSEIDTGSHIGKLMYNPEIVSDSRILSDSHIGKRMLTELDGSTYIFVYATAELWGFLTANINVTIPPNGEVRIDSNAFTAMLGQQNIIHLYSGDWIEFTRDMIVLNVEAGTSGDIDGNIVYDERYL